ncbi:MAG: hypothetical protein WB711_16720 [Terriglobales bacterium]
MLRLNQTRRLASSWLDDMKSLDHGEVPFVERGQMASTFERRRGDNQIISPDHFAGRLQIRPEVRLSIRGLLGTVVADVDSRALPPQALLDLGANL